MSQIKSIGTAVPRFRHEQNEILHFMSRIYAFNEKERRTLKYLYHQSGISRRYSVLPDYTLEPDEWTFYPPTENLEPFPSLEERMDIFNREAVGLSVRAITGLSNWRSGSEGNYPPDHRNLYRFECTGVRPSVD